MLKRALSKIQNGFYIDIGAGDPIVDSVTKLFYDDGWHGINVEPNPKKHLELVSQRQRDVNMNIAIGSSSKAIDFWVMDHDGLSTASKEQFLKHESDGLMGYKVTVESQPLSYLYRNLPIGTEVHFLKIDVEGWEKEVLSGANFNEFRPWIVVIEATIPNTQIDNSKEWLDLLLDSNYKIVYRDGLNIFFLAQEKQELKSKFEFPPNVFDDFAKYDHSLISELSTARSELSTARSELSTARSELSTARSELSTARSELSTARSELSTVEKDLIEIKQSNIWRKTRFLRTLKSFLMNYSNTVK
jgi:FkbM family methyltransferase